MITNVSIVSVFVTDQDKAKAFYTAKLGFVEQADITIDNGFRWCAVCHPDHPELMLNLAIPGPPADPELVEAITRSLAKGNHGGVGMATDDCKATVEELRAKGVDIIQEPVERPYGIEAMIRDDCGNWIVLVETTPYAGTDLAADAVAGDDA
jgi:catechol 2,3-dioxygenase-like lactoylglutathione lyase family enzyme